jgi:hypothetical protein
MIFDRRAAVMPAKLGAAPFRMASPRPIGLAIQAKLAAQCHITQWQEPRVFGVWFMRVMAVHSEHAFTSMMDCQPSSSIAQLKVKPSPSSMQPRPSGDCPGQLQGVAWSMQGKPRRNGFIAASDRQQMGPERRQTRSSTTAFVLCSSSFY